MDNNRQEYARLWYLKNKEKSREASARYRKANLTKIVQRGMDVYYRDPSKVIAKNKEWLQTTQGRLNTYRNGAKRRNIDFNLTLEEFKLFWDKPCVYCATMIRGVGLDRVDNTRGYTKDNVVPCCRDCNEMKMNRTRDEFLNHIRKIALANS